MSYLNETQLAAAITSIKGRAAKLDNDIQVAALSAAHIFAENGNVMYINTLFKALGKGARHAAMTEWLTAFAGVSANDKEGKDVTPFVKDRNKQVDLVKGAATKWFDMKPSPKPDDVMDYLALAMAMLKRKPKEGQEVAHIEVRDQLAAIVEAISKADEAAVLEATDETTEEA